MLIVIQVKYRYVNDESKEATRDQKPDPDVLESAEANVSERLRHR